MITIFLFGSRDLSDIGMSLIRTKLLSIAEQYGLLNVKMIAGGARGTDNVAATIARELGFYVNDKDYTPDFSGGYDVSKYHERNDRLIQDCDMAIGFWDGKSPGTRSVIQKCLNRHKHLEVIFIK